MNKIKNIIYFLPAQKFPSGGAMVIYRHSYLINKMKINGLKSYIVHYKKKKLSKFVESIKKKINFKKNKNIFGYNFIDFKVEKNFIPDKNWINIPVLNKNDFNFNSNEDFLIFPEIIAHFSETICLKKRIRYSILVQGVYHMHQTNNFKRIYNSYKNAEFIITTTKTSERLFLNIFPKIKKKIKILNLSINSKIFYPSKKKSNTITCMPRKLENHFHLLKLFLNDKLAKKWKILSLTNLNNKEIIKKLNKSKIFLSFSNLEGLGLPPLEAALSGNKIIGYTGEGGKDYFKKPIFEIVMNGDILTFSKKILKSVKTYEKLSFHKNINAIKARSLLAKKYSLSNEIKSLEEIFNL